MNMGGKDCILCVHTQVDYWITTVSLYECQLAAAYHFEQLPAGRGVQGLKLRYEF